MKRNFLLITLLILCETLFGQGSFEIGPNSAWKVDKLINVISKKDKRCKGDETYKLFVKGDTTINALNYYKIFKSGIMYLDTIFEYSDQYFGAIRESNKKVYYIEKAKNTETLLYNFDLHVGDTIKSLIANGKMVINIDTLEDGRKRFQITKTMLHGMDAYIIEGIGTTGGLLSEPSVGHYMYNDSYLICYSENSIIKYNGNDPMDDGCYLSSSRFPINPTATWKIYKYTLTMGENEKLDEIYQYYISGDTILNSLDYYKLFKSGVMYYDTAFYYKGIYVGAIRDDTNKIFYLEKGGTSEVQLFDFNLKLGDTIKSVIGNGRIVNFIDTLPSGRKRFEYKNYITAGCASIVQIIEGIGHMGGLMEGLPCVHIGYYGSYLACYSENGLPVYQNTKFSGTDCGSISDISHTIKNISMKIYPVPVKNFVNIYFTNLSHNRAFLSIYDVTGKSCFLRSLDLNANNESYRVDLSHLKSGVYIVRISGNNLNTYGMLIKE